VDKELMDDNETVFRIGFKLLNRPSRMQKKTAKIAPDKAAQSQKSLIFLNDVVNEKPMSSINIEKKNVVSIVK